MIKRIIHLLAISYIAMHGATASAQQENTVAETANIGENTTLEDCLQQLGAIAERLDNPQAGDVSKILEAILDIADRIYILGNPTLADRESKKLQKIVEKLKSNAEKALESEGKLKPLLKKVRVGLRQLEKVFTDKPTLNWRDRHGFRYPRHH